MHFEKKRKYWYNKVESKTFFFVLNTFSKQNEGQKKQLSEYQQTDLKPFVLTLKRTYLKRPILKVFC